MSEDYEKYSFFAWDILIKCADDNKTITYKELTDQIGLGLFPRQAGRFLDPIQIFCLEERLPPLTIIAVRMDNQKPGSGFTAWEDDNFENLKSKVFNFKWNSIQNPFSYTQKGQTTDKIVKELILNPGKIREFITIVKSRGINQIIFRKMILKIYDRCAFCGFSTAVALEAVHIKPWEKCADTEKLDMKNGILLCGTHHKLFDCKYLTIGDDYKIKAGKTASIINKYDEYFIKDLIGKEMYLPTSENNYPSLEYIKFHRGGG
jgi:putative restriction endonuclease